MRFDEFEVEEGDEADGATCWECLQPLVPGDLVRQRESLGYEHATCTGEPE